MREAVVSDQASGQAGSHSAAGTGGALAGAGTAQPAGAAGRAAAAPARPAGTTGGRSASAASAAPPRARTAALSSGWTQAVFQLRSALKPSFLSTAAWTSAGAV